MSTFKCKMCGGTLEIEPNETIATCEYCGTQQTLPKLDDERRANLYDRTNHFRRNNEFDKAMAERGYFTVDKGSVTVNGVSLTVCNPTANSFTVAIIPYTHDNTNFCNIGVGTTVNIEFDILGKYIARLQQLK